MKILSRIGLSVLIICLVSVAGARAISYFRAAGASCSQADSIQSKDLEQEALYTLGEIRTTSSGGKELTLLAEKYKLALYVPEVPAGVEWGGQYLLSIKKYNSISQIRKQSPDMEGFTSYLNSKGTCGTVQQVSWSDKVGQTDLVGKFFYELRANLAKPLQQNLPPQSAALLQALILGEKNSLDSQSKEQFIELGVMHVFVVSGFHFTLLSGLLWQVLGAKWLPFKRLSPNYKRLIMLSVLFGYLLLLGPGNYSALRAFIVLGLTIITLQLGQPLPLIQRVLMVLPAAVIIEPAVLQSVGFQMSYGAWALLALLSPLLHKGKAKVAGSLDAMLAAELTTAVWGTMLLMPLSLNLFGSWPIWAILFGPLLAICLSHTQKVLYISTVIIWTAQALNITHIVSSVFAALALPVERILTWLKDLSLPDISIAGGSNISLALTCGYCSYLIFYLVKIYGPSSSEKVLARYSL